MFARKTQKPHLAEGARNESEVITEVIIQESLSWEASRTHLLEKSEQRAWVIARAGLGIAIAALLCLAAMIPFYKVIPVVFKVDNLTGEILEMQTDKAALPQSEKMDKYLLSQYVQLRERYVWTLLDNDYNTVIALSDTNVGKDYSAIYTGENALDKKLGPNTDIRVTLIAVAIISAPTPQVQASQSQTGKAQVTWERTMRQNGSDVEVKKRFISTISYGYTNNQVINLKQQLFANPFGFQVDGYAVASVLNDDKPDTASRNSTKN